MKTILFFLLLVSIDISAQEYIFGKVLSEDGRELQDVSIINISNQQTSTTNSDGNFMIFAKVGDEIRFTKERYTRVSQKVNASDFSKTLLVHLNIIPFEIDEVKIKQKLTGDLENDADHFGKKMKVVQLEIELGKYNKAFSTPEIMRPKPGEFVQPVGSGFSMGGSKPQWDDLDFYNFLIKTLPSEFFVKDLNLKQFEIMNFVFFIFKDFPRSDILKYGWCNSEDFLRFQMVSFQKIEKFNAKFSNLK